MNLKTQNMDMLHGPLIKKLLFFTLPIALSSIVQQLFNAADTAVVGFFSDANALAAVGTNTEIIALIVTVSSGLSIGANVLIADRIGRNKQEEVPSAVRTAVLLSVLIGIAGAFFGQIIAGTLLRLIRTPGAFFIPRSCICAFICWVIHFYCYMTSALRPCGREETAAIHSLRW